jgi:serine/threonine protein kinase
LKVRFYFGKSYGFFDGGYTNEVFLLEETNPQLIAKCSNIFNNDGLAEVRSLQMLENGSVFPKFHDYFESGSSRVIMMDFKYGVNGQSILDQGNISKSLKLYELLGEYLAKEIHSIKFSIEDQYLPVYKKNMEDLDQLNLIPRSLISEVDHMLSDENEENLVLIHGDYGSHNSIVDDELLLYIIDWQAGVVRFKILLGSFGF